MGKFYPHGQNCIKSKFIGMKFISVICFFFLISVSLPVHAQSTVGEIPLPDKEYQRVVVEKGSFGAWLRVLPLKPAGSPVLDYRGRIYKSAEDTAVGAVIDMDIHGRRLEQCMDILVRLYAEYVWQAGAADELILPLPGGYWLGWKSWAQGFRTQYQGVKVSLIHRESPDYSPKNFDRYLREIYANSHTLQFYYNYEPIDYSAVQPGDVIIKNGRKKHAVMIVDLAQNSTGDLIGLIGHGDTPACQFFLLRHNKNTLWFALDKDQEHLPLPIRRKMSWTGLRRLSERKTGIR